MGAAAPPAGSAEPSADRQSLQRGDHGGGGSSPPCCGGAEKASAGREKGISRPTAEQGKLIGQAESGEVLSSAKRKTWNKAEADDRPLDGLTAQAEEFQQARRADAFWRSEPFSAGTLPGLLMAEGSRAAMEVEDISRAVQWDARRYDGGFTMF